MGCSSSIKIKEVNIEDLSLTLAIQNVICETNLRQPIWDKSHLRQIPSNYSTATEFHFKNFKMDLFKINEDSNEECLICLDKDNLQQINCYNKVALNFLI